MQYYSDFPWDDYCFHARDPSLCAETITEVIISSMKLYIIHTFFNTKAKKSQFNSACSHAVKDREAALKPYRSHTSAKTHAIYISVRNNAKYILQLIKNSFRDFWHLANNIFNRFSSSSFPPLSPPDGFTSIPSFSKAELFA